MALRPSSSTSSLRRSRGGVVSDAETGTPPVRHWWKTTEQFLVNLPTRPFPVAIMCLFLFSVVSWLTSSALISNLGPQGTGAPALGGMGEQTFVGLAGVQPEAEPVFLHTSDWNESNGVLALEKRRKSVVQQQLGSSGVSRASDRGAAASRVFQPAAMPEGHIVSKVAFGSCTARVVVPQPIWAWGVIPSEPHAWIWNGDFSYTDAPGVDCRVEVSHKNCNCTKNWLRKSKASCLAGDIPHAKWKLGKQVNHPDYKEFLKFMCSQPGTEVGPPPPMYDLSSCARPILGTWDDHDYNWQDGDRRLPTKEQQKELFLDAFGVPPYDERRERGRGLYTKHVLNAGVRGKEIDVLLLDERFHKDPKPCHNRREFCEKVALSSPTKEKYTWCMDFLLGEAGSKPSCCSKDERMYQGWCKNPKSVQDPLWRHACDPTYRHYGADRLILDQVTGRLRLRAKNESCKGAGVTIAEVTEGKEKEEEIGRGGGGGGGGGGGDGCREEEEEEDKDGVLCDILGFRQRKWLRNVLYESDAPLKLLVSGSPVINNPKPFICGKALKKRPAVQCVCLDDFDCFRPAQINLIHTMVGAPGCVVVLTGDLHFSDIKVIRSGQNLYSADYMTANLPHPVYQVMASGLTTDTARNFSCDGIRLDHAGLREHGDCAIVTGPAFGMLEVDWDSPERLVHLEIRDGHTGAVRLRSRFSLNGCQSVF
ncbi:hypothetical protein CBR_g24078 [Chara braunii]|uniref:Uncharacterized protein n=1 Tax=Chara braunii TaxID=69332 RepID=A0A388L5W5_CHABU|nr:hypothetical protein CBR_g24078 [Chara braunii]|eukprot:GBG77632.1 hypothetical protein CBR_g24078 [Chara braunii]